MTELGHRLRNDAREGIDTGIRDGYAPDTHRYATDTHGYANGYAQDTQDTQMDTHGYAHGYARIRRIRTGYATDTHDTRIRHGYAGYARIRTDTHGYATDTHGYANGYARMRTDAHKIRRIPQTDTHKYARIRTGTHRYACPVCAYGTLHERRLEHKVVEEEDPVRHIAVQPRIREQELQDGSAMSSAMRL